jgi:putative nucleotidyltransferase with HDIG domain
LPTKDAEAWSGARTPLGPGITGDGALVMESSVGVGRELPNVAVTDIPPLPEAALYVLSIARKPAISADEVARALGSDQSIALRFLSIANSAYFATTHRITTLSHCVAWLGLDFVCSTLVALGIDRSAAAISLPQFDRMAFWEHNMGVAACAEMVASRIHNTVPGEAYLGGLCHDLGKLVLALTEGDVYGSCLLQAATSGRALYDIETDMTGLDHALVGASALREWKLSPELIYVVLNHHEDDAPSAQGKLLPVLMMAQGIVGSLSATAGSPARSRAEARIAVSMRRLRVDDELVEGVSRDLASSLDKVQSAVLAMTG